MTISQSLVSGVRVSVIRDDLVNSLMARYRVFGDGISRTPDGRESPRKIASEMPSGSSNDMTDRIIFAPLMSLTRA